MIKLSTSLESTITCPDGWVKQGSSCFFVSSVKYNWVEAEETCRQTPGASLASCLTRTEAIYLATTLESGNDFWVGVNDL